MQRQRAFTFVELLVVIAMIAVVVTILLPSLSRAREAAIRIQCASNLKQWGTALWNYAADNRGDLPRSWPLYSGIYPFTARVQSRMDNSTGTIPAILSLEMMGKYLRGVPSDLVNTPMALRRTSGVWRCPSTVNNRADMDAVNQANWTLTSPSNGWIYCDYSYYARSDLWTPANGYRPTIMSNPEDILRNRMDANRICMTDVCFVWNTNPAGQSWFYNHGQNGTAAMFHGTFSGELKMRGMNQLFGDGHVVWKLGSSFNVTLMKVQPPAPGPGCRFVQAGGTNLALPTDDVSFY